MKKMIRKNKKGAFWLFIGTIIGLSIWASACSNDKSYTEESDHESQVKEIKNTLTDMWDAIEKKDIDRYASFIHPEFTQFGETDPILKEGKEVEVKAMRDWLKNASEIHTEMEDPRVTINGNVAWIVYYWSDKGISNGAPFTSRGKSTRIFVKENDKWLCIHGHYTLLP